MQSNIVSHLTAVPVVMTATTSRPSVLRRLGRLLGWLTRQVPVTADPLVAYARVAKAYERWSDRAATPQAAEYWAAHARAIRELIADRRNSRRTRAAADPAADETGS